MRDLTVQRLVKIAANRKALRAHAVRPQGFFYHRVWLLSSAASEDAAAVGDLVFGRDQAQVSVRVFRAEDHAFAHDAAQFCGLVGAMIAKEYPECDWQWEHPDPLALLKKGEDVYVFLRQKEGYKRALVQMQGFFPKGLTFPDEQKQENAEPPKQIAERVDYDLVAFEWMEANLARLNERCNDAIGAGEGELVLSPSELPERGSWEKLCEMLQREGLQGVQPTEDAIKITLSTAVERRNNVKRDQSV